MRVLLWAEMFWPSMGGGSQFTAELAVALRERGHTLTVITRRDEPDLADVDSFRGIPVHRFPFHQALSLGNIDQMARLRQKVIELKRKFAADLIHTMSFGASMLFQMDTSRTYPAPLLVTLCGEENSGNTIRDTVLHRVLQSADWVTAPSQATLEYAHKLVPTCVSRSSVIHNAMEMPPLPPEPLPFDPPRLLYLGRLSPEKRVDLMLDALANLVTQRPSPQLVIAGDGPERERLERQTSRLGLRDHVQFLGWVTSCDVLTLINSVTLVLLASEREAFGLSALEAAFMARPVVASRRGGLPEVVEHGTTGLLIDELNAVSLAEAVAWLLEHPESASRMGRAARTRARKAFNWRDCIDAYDALYKKIAKARDKSPLEEPYV